MENSPQKTVDLPVQAGRDHILGSADAEMTLVEYGWPITMQPLAPRNWPSTQVKPRAGSGMFTKR